MEKEGKKEQVGEGVLLAFGRQSSPYWQVQKRRREEWVLVPTGEEEAGMGQLVEMVLVVEPLPVAAAAAHSFGLLAFLVIPFYFLHPSPIHRAAAANSLRAAAAGIGIGGVGYLQV